MSELTGGLLLIGAALAVCLPPCPPASLLESDEVVMDLSVPWELLDRCLLIVADLVGDTLSPFL